MPEPAFISLRPVCGRPAVRSPASTERRRVQHTRDDPAGRRVPYLPCTGLGFSCRRPHGPPRWALTPPFHHHPTQNAFRHSGPGCPFSVTLSVAMASPMTPPLSQGILPCGVRTFLSGPCCSHRLRRGQQIKERSECSAAKQDEDMRRFMARKANGEAGRPTGAQPNSQYRIRPQLSQ